jgi:hypothetical protein
MEKWGLSQSLCNLENGFEKKNCAFIPEEARLISLIYLGLRRL